MSLPPKVTGIGGIFFFSDDPNQTKAWYAENLGLATDQYGSTFEFRNANRPEEINYRVQNIEALVEKLRAAGATIVDEIETYDYGKFVHILDPEGNKIELWEPIDSVFTAMGGETTK